LWYWNIFRTIGASADENNINIVTKKINGGHIGYSERKISTKNVFNNVIKTGDNCKVHWESTLTSANGWG
jgi:hypothetical protein